MSAKPKTAEEWHEHLTKQMAADRLFKQRQAEAERYEDLRDDCVSLLRNSGLSYEDVHQRLGPHPSTLKAWELKTVSRPQLGKMRAALRTIGKDIGIVDVKSNVVSFPK